LNFTRIRNEGVRTLVDSLKGKKWKAIRYYDRKLYSLDLTNNFIEQEGVCHLLDLFYDQFKVESSVQFAKNTPVPTSIRILTLDFNFIGKVGADALA
jgi:hypothetical protein